MKNKTIEIIAGPNGSGKSTFAEGYFLKRKKLNHFINPDAIAAGLSPLNVEAAAFQAGRIMITEIKDSIRIGKSFAFESTLSGKTWLPILKKARDNGYQISIYFIYLSKVQDNIERIKKRVSQGGHFIPPQVVRRRYPKAFYNFWNDYRSICDNWFVFDNSTKKPKLIQKMRSFEDLSEEKKTEFEALFFKGLKNGHQ